jgi:hypothetical protein
VRRGINTGNDTGESATVQVTSLTNLYYAAVSTSVSTSFAQAGLAGTASISVSAFIPPTFTSLTILDGNFSVIEELTGSFVSGNIFGGDKFHWSGSCSLFTIGHPTQSLIAVSGALAYPVPLTTIISGAAAAAVPTEGQVFPRGVFS